MTYILNDVANAIHTGLRDFGGYAANAANKANGVSAAAQSAAANFNAGQSALANNITSQNLAAQYDYNSAQAAMANQYSSMMWDKSAAWNEEMWERQAEFNRVEAEKNRKWQEMMRATAYQTAVQDMQKAGINPILAAGGISASAGGGSAASVGGVSMSPMSGQMASGGVIGGQDSSISGYTGQMEYLSGLLGLLSAGMAGITSAMKCFAQVPNGEDIAKSAAKGLFHFWEDHTPAGAAEKWGRTVVGPKSDEIMEKAKEALRNKR